MFNEPNLTRISITIGDNTTSWETPHNDTSMEDMLSAFYGLCIAHTWPASAILREMKEFAEDHLPFVDADYQKEEAA